MLSSTLLANTYTTGGSFSAYSQKTLRAAMTFNRLTIFIFPQKHEKVQAYFLGLHNADEPIHLQIFQLRKLKFIILACFAAPVPLLAVCPLTHFGIRQSWRIILVSLLFQGRFRRYCLVGSGSLCWRGREQSKPTSRRKSSPCTLF